MNDKNREQKPLRERIQDRIRDLLDDLVEALDGMFQPEPEPVRIPIRRR